MHMNNILNSNRGKGKKLVFFFGCKIKYVKVYSI